MSINPNLMIDGDAALTLVNPHPWLHHKQVDHAPCGQVDPSKIVFFQTMKSDGVNLSCKTRQANLNPVNINVLVFLERNRSILDRVPLHCWYVVATETRFISERDECYFKCLSRGENGTGWQFGWVNEAGGSVSFAVVAFTS